MKRNNICLLICLLITALAGTAAAGLLSPRSATATTITSVTVTGNGTFLALFRDAGKFS